MCVMSRETQPTHMRWDTYGQGDITRTSRLRGALFLSQKAAALDDNILQCFV
jgi:hypothetical protein